MSGYTIDGQVVGTGSVPAGGANGDTLGFDAGVPAWRDAAAERTAISTYSTAQVDALVAGVSGGIAVKPNIQAATSAVVPNLAAVTLAGVFTTYIPVENDRVLVRLNASPDGIVATSAIYNGWYTVGPVVIGVAALTRAADANSNADFIGVTTCIVARGSLAGFQFSATSTDAFVLGTDTITMVQISSGVSVPTTRQVISGAGLTGGGDLSADRTLAVGTGTGITVNADSIEVDTSVISTKAFASSEAAAAAAASISKTLTTTRGDLIRGGVAGVPERIAAVTSGNVVAGDGTDVVSQAIATTLAVAAGANRAALGLPANVSMGTTYALGTAATAFVDVPGTPTAAPTLAPGQSFAVLIFPVANPVASEAIGSHMDTIAAVRGWIVACGYDAGDRGILSLFFLGVTGAGVSNTIPLASATFTGALNAPHVLAVSIIATPAPQTGDIHYSFDGGAVQTIAFPGGVYVPPISGDPLTLGQLPNAAIPSTSVQQVQWRFYSTVLSDADLVAVAATRTSFQLAAPSAGTLTRDLHVRQFDGITTVLDRATSSVRWRLNGALTLHEQP